MTCYADDVDTLQRAVAAWLEYRDLRPEKCLFHTDDEWSNGRGETMASGAKLHANIEECRLSSMTSYGWDSDELEEEFDALLEKHGYYYEIGYSWSIHFWCLCCTGISEPAQWGGDTEANP